jgi:hypothetical protein
MACKKKIKLIDDLYLVDEQAREEDQMAEES